MATGVARPPQLTQATVSRPSNDEGEAPGLLGVHLGVHQTPSDLRQDVQRLADFRGSKGGGGGRSRGVTGHSGQPGQCGRPVSGPLLPSPPAVMPPPPRRNLLDERQLFASAADGSPAKGTVGWGVGVGGGGTPLLVSVTSCESVGHVSVGNDSVSERLKNIHSTFAALRSQSGL